MMIRNHNTSTPTFQYSSTHLQIRSSSSGWRSLLYFLALTVLAVSGCAAPAQQVAGPTAKPYKMTSSGLPEMEKVVVKPGDTLSSLALKYLGDESMHWFIADFNDIRAIAPGQVLLIPLGPYERGGLKPGGYQVVPVLCYHNFSRTESDAMTVTERAFEEQMRLLKDGGYRVITIDEFFDFLEFKRQIPRKSVVITIDDGWRSLYEIAFPILKKYGYRATLFVYTGLILDTEKTLNWDLIRTMSRDVIDVQCHTKTHRNLVTKYSNESFKEYFDALKTELVESARIIKKNLGKDVKYLAYPYGDTSHLVTALTMKLGYRGAFTVNREGNPFFADPYRVHRSMIMGTHRTSDFEKNLVTFGDKALD
ncbi:MAG: polysaccharide deacetylase family protein [Pseudomonadota bacterium]